jgi:hypothetical protein
MFAVDVFYHGQQIPALWISRFGIEYHSTADWDEIHPPETLLEDLEEISNSPYLRIFSSVLLVSRRIVRGEICNRLPHLVPSPLIWALSPVDDTKFSVKQENRVAGAATMCKPNYMRRDVAVKVFFCGPLQMCGLLIQDANKVCCYLLPISKKAASAPVSLNIIIWSPNVWEMSQQGNNFICLVEAPEILRCYA